MNDYISELYSSDLKDNELEYINNRPADCDSCNDDISIDCHDCEQHQDAKQRAAELCVNGGTWGLSAAEERELQRLVANLKGA